MKIGTVFTSKQWGLLLLLLVTAIIAACGGNEATPEPTPTDVPATVAPTATAESTPEEAAAPESPLPAESAAPESPLSQPISPLTPSTSAPQTEEEAIALAAITTAAEPSEGMATVAGVVYSFGNMPGGIPETVVYLEVADEIDGKYFPPAFSIGPQLERGDVATRTDMSGQVHLEATPGNYYLAVWIPYGWRYVVPTPGEEAPRLITLEEGDQLDLGVLYTDWP